MLSLFSTIAATGALPGVRVKWLSFVMALSAAPLNTAVTREWYVPEVAGPRFVLPTCIQWSGTDAQSLAQLADNSWARVLQHAFNESILQFSERTGNSEKDFEFIKSSNSLQDVQCAIKDCIARYEARKPDSKALKWLRQLSEKTIFYEGVVDVIIQQHPESVSLIWGGMKFLFMVRLQG